ncbi:MAG: chorismate synthase [Nonlabens sp.]|uniref:chorismate synthase n=1 Tax=Nonlabens sp. TaxID=1888209 RepID=UPI003EF8876A
MFKKISLAFIAIIALTACSTDTDDGGNGGGNNFSYLPLTTNNSWDYDVVTGTTVTNDNLTVSSVSGSNYTLTANPAVPNGLMTGVLSSGELTAANGQLIGNGTLGFDFQGVGDFSIDIVDGVLYDQNASNGSELYSTSGTFTETIDSYDLDINYVATTVQKANVATMTVPSGTYSNVLHSQLIINVSISTEISIGPITQTINLLQPQNQDVIVVDNYWAQDVGLIKSDNQLDYSLADFSALGVNLPVPQSASVLTTQELTAFTIN